MVSLKKVKEILQKGLCMRASVEDEQQQDDIDDLDSLTDNVLYQTTYFSTTTNTDGRFEDLYAQYQGDLESGSTEASSNNDPWTSNMRVLNAYDYKNPVEINPYEQMNTPIPAN
jgi:hypothetical protein